MLLGTTAAKLLVVVPLLLGACTDNPPVPVAQDPQETTQDSQATLIEVPDVTNQRFGLAKKTIAESGLETGPVERVGDGTKNIVLEQHPAAGSMVPAASLISIAVSKVFPVPLLTIPGVGNFGWTCKASGTIIQFTVEKLGASTQVVIRESADGKHTSRLLHPRQTLKSLANERESQRWTLVQATKPRTVRSEVSIVPQPTCETFVPPQISLEMRAKSHSVLQ